MIAGVTDDRSHPGLWAAYMVRLDERRGVTCTLTLEDASASHTRVLDTLVRDVDIQPRDLFSWAGDPRLAGVERIRSELIAELNELAKVETDPDNLSAEAIRLLSELEGADRILRARVPIADPPLASFVRPNHPVVAEVAREAATIKAALTGNASFHAFQIEDRSRPRVRPRRPSQPCTRRCGAATLPTPNPPRLGLLADWPADPLLRGMLAAGGLGTCMDTTVLLAAVLEQGDAARCSSGYPATSSSGTGARTPFQRGGRRQTRTRTALYPWISIRSCGSSRWVSWG